MTKCFYMAFLVVAIATGVHAYNEYTHKQITEYVLKYELVVLDDFIKTKMGFPEGISKKLNIGNLTPNAPGQSKSIKAWIVEGGGEEDDNNGPRFGLGRSSNHFLDPTKLLPEERTFQLPLLPIIPNHIPADDWAMSIWGTQDDVNDLVRDNMSYYDAINYYRIWLTGYDLDGAKVASTQAEREAYLAKSFMALGQVMHLVEDMAVPEHTRLDPHAPNWALTNPYERWCELNDPEIVGFLGNITPGHKIDGNVAIRGLFSGSGGSYDEINGETYYYEGGVANFTNSNFFSKDTICRYITTGWGQCEYYSPPLHQIALEEPYAKNKWLSLSLYSPFFGTVWQYRHVASDGTVIEPVIEYVPPHDWDIGNFVITEDVIREYASILVPRAALYATNVLENFFRYEVNASPAGYGIARGLTYEKYRRDYAIGEVPDVSTIISTPFREANPGTSTSGICSSEECADSTRVQWYGWHSIGQEWTKVFASATDDNIPLGSCYTKYLGSIPQFMGGPGLSPVVIDKDLSVRATTPGNRIKDGATLQVVTPRQKGCENVPYTRSITPEKVMIFGARNNSFTEDYITTFPISASSGNSWDLPSFGSDDYWRYRFVLTGNVDPTSQFAFDGERNVFLIAYASDPVVDFTGASTPYGGDYETFYLLPNDGLLELFKASYYCPMASDSYLSNGLIIYDQGVCQSCELYTGPRVEIASGYEHTIAKDQHLNNTYFTRDSKVVLDHAGSGTPFWVSLTLKNLDTGEETIFYTGDATSVNGKTLYDLNPEYFLNNEKYVLVDIYRHPSFRFGFQCQPPAFAPQHFTVSRIGLLP